MKSPMISTVLFSLLLCLSRSAQCGCAPLTVDGFRVSFIDRQGFEIKDVGGKVTAVDIDEAPRSKCLSLKLSPARDRGMALIEARYQTGESGTRVLIDDTDFALLSLRDRKLVFDPITLDEDVAENRHRVKSEKSIIIWKKTDTSFILEKKDVESEEISQLWPSLTPKPAAQPSPETSAMPAVSSPKPQLPGFDSLD